MKPSCALFLVLAPVVPVFAADTKDPFQELVRPTEPLTPEQQRAAFHLPAGFEIQLVASEPDLRKPMNMQWDALGRLWITESREYPFAIKDGTPGRDTVRILSDFAPDGRARKVKIFADGLNIPIGLYPFRSRRGNEAGTSEKAARLLPSAATWKCVVWSIPNVWLMEDTDGDGRADKREVLFGPLGWERDTHGNLASFRRGADGWLYGTHGFNNESTLRGRDGSELRIQSGNTWRIRLDGSRVEGWTYGQVNPFGLCWDDRGNLFSADCHSSPIYQLLRGAYYPSFGKPHDGLGFAPQTIRHSHGSTAICAPIYISDPAWPAEFQDHMLVGNVQTSRLNHDAIEWHGSSSKGRELPDFLTCDDPWFRPVDLSWGPDGALYIADFYNRIIGHYEVPLTHPGRDRERGRIWRIVYKGDAARAREADTPVRKLPTDVAGWISELASANPTRRTLALDELCDVHGADALPAIRAVFTAPRNAFQKLNAVWALHRLGALDDVTLLAALGDEDPLVRIHAAKAGAAAGGALRAALGDADPFVRRAAAEGLATHPAPENLKPLLTLLRTTDATDDHLIYATRAALRDHLRVPAVVSKFDPGALPKPDLQAILDIMPAVPGEYAALLRLDLFERLDAPPAEIAKHLPGIIREAPVARLEGVAALARRKFPDDAAVLAGIVDALDARGLEPGAGLREWAAALVPQILAGKAAAAWTNDGPGRSPWAMQERKCADGQAAQLLSSFPNGETLTGTLRSAPFAAPGKLRFFLCGHDGFPGTPAGKRNFVRLVDAADGRVLREAAPPRNDVAQRIEWELADVRGKMVRFEATDDDTGRAYAWIAFGRFEPGLPELAPIGPPGRSPRAIVAGLAARFGLREHAATLGAIFSDRTADVESRAAAARGLIAFRNEGAGSLSRIAAALSSADEPAALRERLAVALGEVNSPGVCKLVADAMSTSPARLQQAFATALSANRSGAVVLLDAIETGKASTAVLRDKATLDRLRTAAKGDELKRLEALLAKLPPASAESDRLIAARRGALDPAKADAPRGAQIFQANCAVCHAIEGGGGALGPQLDGIGGRGADRLIEDILDPNRNVDRAFRMNVITLKNNTVVAGLPRRDEGPHLILADAAGGETRIVKAEIAERKETGTSLMPAAFGETISPGDFNDLLAFLLGKRAPK